VGITFDDDDDDDDKTVITGTSGTISKSFRKYLSHRPGNQTYRKQRKQPFWALRTCLGKYKLKSTKRLSWKQHHVCQEVNPTVAVTLRTRETWFVSGTQL
jgi:hypothetical protein